MNRSFEVVAPDRLRIREGGGCMSAFGIPFFVAGVFLLLTTLGIVPVSNASELSLLAWPLFVLMGAAFTAVGGVLVFGRSWTTIDRSERSVIKQWGLLIPLHERIVPLHGYTAVALGFVEGDSDSADRFPISLKASTGPDLPLCSFTAYAQARECAAAVADHLQLEFEDASTDHPVRLSASQVDIPFQARLRREDALHSDPIRPSDARSQVTRGVGEVTIVIPARRLPALMLVVALIPIAIPLVIAPPLATFFRQSQTPGPVGWVFFGFLTLVFGVLPTTTVVGAFLRSRRGATIIAVSRQGLRVHKRGVWTTKTVTSLDASDILDIDYSSRESTAASARRAAEQQVLQSRSSDAATVSPRVERILAKLTQFAKGKGVTVKTRRGLTSFGQGLDDAEVRYLHAVVRRALVE